MADQNQKFECLRFEVRDQIGWLTLNRPQALNALNQKLLAELDSVLDQVQLLSLKDLRMLILRGEGDKAFVAGADIKEMIEFTSAQAQEFSIKGQKIFAKLESLSVPTLACVHGFALGGGLELAMACDLIWAGPRAKFGLPESKLGLIPGFGGTVRLPRRIGWSDAIEWMSTGKMVSAEDAFKIHLVQRVFSDASDTIGFFQSCESAAKEWIVQGPLALARIKALKAWSHESDSRLFEKESQLFSELFDFKDTKEGLSAFVEKRTAKFKAE